MSMYAGSLASWDAMRRCDGWFCDELSVHLVNLVPRLASEVPLVLGVSGKCGALDGVYPLACSWTSWIDIPVNSDPQSKRLHTG